jgi:hypothetical protein
MELAVCPFCKGELNPQIEIRHNGIMNKWVLFHACDKEAATSIMMTADTKEEVIKRWNASQNRKEV